MTSMKTMYSDTIYLASSSSFSSSSISSSSSCFASEAKLLHSNRSLAFPKVFARLAVVVKPLDPN